jgi:hypothetical protein
VKHLVDPRHPWRTTQASNASTTRYTITSLSRLLKAAQRRSRLPLSQYLIRDPFGPAIYIIDRVMCYERRELELVGVSTNLRMGVWNFLESTFGDGEEGIRFLA